MNHHEAVLHVRGEARFVDDEPTPAGTLHAAVVTSPTAHGRLLGIDAGEAERLPGVRAILTCRDVPGKNQVGTIIPDEPLLAEAAVHYLGQPVALVVADSDAQARRAARAVHVHVEPLPPVFDARAAYARGELIFPQRTFARGDVDSAWAACAVVVAGRAETGAQEHVYLETQGAVAIPGEGGTLRLLSATQAPTAVQRVVAGVLGVPMHRVEVEVRRLGGGFGGKEDQATPWAGLAALGAWCTGRPVKLVLRRQEDMRWTGKRHPYSSDFRIGLDRDGRILAYEVFFYQNAGATADLSPAILERTLFHATNAYFIPHVRATAASCRTNLPSNTAFRGFGGPQAMFVLEAAIARAAAEMGLEPAEIQRRNLLREGEEFPYGMRMASSALTRCWTEAETRYDLPAIRRRAAEFNDAHRLEKQGVAVMPVCFGISFTNTVLNQAGALVHVHTDGSVSVSTGAVEMGQGTAPKLRQVAAATLGIDPERVRIDSTSTSRVASTSPTAASTGPDMNGHATRLAGEAILARLREVAARRLAVADAATIGIRAGQVHVLGRPAGFSWAELVGAAYAERVSLSAHAHYATPRIHFDKATGRGEPFAYHACGVAIVEATVDVLRGECRIDAVRVVHDAGHSIDPLVDRGQVEGGLLQGIGWMTMEEVLHLPSGGVATDTLTTYKVPDLYAAPDEVEVHFLEPGGEPAGIMGAKAVGEPPLMYGIGAFFAVHAAIRAARPGTDTHFVAPLSAERILAALSEPS